MAEERIFSYSNMSGDNFTMNLSDVMVCPTNLSGFNTSLLPPECVKEVDATVRLFENIVQYVVPVIFGLIVLIGVIGNLLVIIVVVSNKQMRNTTNLLIINLAIADLCFIIICVPFTAAMYAHSYWLFGSVMCKIVHYMSNVSAYESMYTLVMMSFDRYLAVVHPIRSMSLRNERNATIVIIISWVLFLSTNVHVLFQYDHRHYTFEGENRSACINTHIADDQSKLTGKLFYGCFFVFGYILPLSVICILYGFMLNRLLYGVMARNRAASAESMRSKKRVTRMVVIVVLIFAVCWLPLQIIFLIQYFGTYPESLVFVGFQIFFNVLAYMNSCVNPILYAFLSDNFRKSFRKLLSCGQYQPARMEFERTNAKALENSKSCTTQFTNSNNLLEKNENGNGCSASTNCKYDML